MSDLHQQSCTACKADAPAVSTAEQAELLRQLPQWQITQDGVDKLTRKFTFKNFIEAMTFAQRVADLAEQHQHHPLLCVAWGEVQVTWWTHKIRALHLNDFILAAKTDILYS